MTRNVTTTRIEEFYAERMWAGSLTNALLMGLWNKLMVQRRRFEQWSAVILYCNYRQFFANLGTINVFD
jgi:hypothetical protein